MWNFSAVLLNREAVDISRVARSDLLVRTGVIVAMSINDLKTEKATQGRQLAMRG